MKALLFCTVLCAGVASLTQKTAGQKPPVAQQTPQAQSQIANEAEEQTKITLDVTRVNILFTVTDKKGRFVTDLGQERLRDCREQEAADHSAVHGGIRSAAAAGGAGGYEQQHSRRSSGSSRKRPSGSSRA